MFLITHKGEIMKKLIDEVTDVGNPIKMWSIVNALLILAGTVMLIFDSMYVGMILAGVVDQLCVLIFYRILKNKRMQGLYLTIETTGKYIVFIGAYTSIIMIIVHFIINTENSNVINCLMSGVALMIIIHITTRFVYFKDILSAANPKSINTMGHYNLLTFFKKEPEIIYITDMDIQAPFYGVECGDFEIIHEKMRHKQRDYKTYPILTYLLEHNKNFEDLTDEEFEIFKKIKHFE